MTSTDIQLETSSLQPLFDMANNFVNIVFVPFSTLTGGYNQFPKYPEAFNATISTI